MTVLAGYSPMTFICTADLARARAFYRDTLGLPLTSEDPGAAVFDLNGIVLRVTAVESHRAVGHTVLGWIVPDIVAKLQELTAHGVQFHTFPGLPQNEIGILSIPDGAKIAWFKDPDGNLLSLTQFPVN